MINNNLFDICVKFNHIFKNESHKKCSLSELLKAFL